MSIRVMEKSRQRKLPDHIEAAQQLGDEAVKGLVGLAKQLRGTAVLPIVGAGASFDCGVRLAKELSPELFHDYTNNPAYADGNGALDAEDLAAVAEAIRAESDQTQVVRDLGFPDEEIWRPAGRMGDHFCVYCVLARLAKERFAEEAIGFNYDCGAEAGFEAEGMSPEESEEGRGFPTHVAVIADEQARVELQGRGSFKLYKAHGCAARYRELKIQDEERAAEGIVVCRSQLDNWEPTASGWIRGKLEEQAKDHVLLFLGFSAQDPRFGDKLRDVLGYVYEQLPANGLPRIVAIDREPRQPTIQDLVQAGLGEATPDEGVVTDVQVGEGATATAALLVLLTEILALDLEKTLASAGVELPDSIDQRIAALVVSAPTMARWAYALRRPEDGEFIQRANVMEQRGYVPLNERPGLTVKLIRARRELRRRLGHPEEESSEEALANDGFIVHQNVAYLPVGIDHETLLKTCRQGQELEKVREGLPHPELDCVLVSGKGDKLRGISLQSGEGADFDWVD